MKILNTIVKYDLGPEFDIVCNNISPMALDDVNKLMRFNGVRINIRLTDLMMEYLWRQIS